MVNIPAIAAALFAVNFTIAHPGEKASAEQVQREMTPYRHERLHQLPRMCSLDVVIRRSETGRQLRETCGISMTVAPPPLQRNATRPT